MRMIREGLLENKKLLLIDRMPKNKNDRTWCFWESVNGFFEPVVCKKWDQLLFKSPLYSALLDIDPYQYKMIRAIDFYRYCFNEISRHPAVEILYTDVKSVEMKDSNVVIETDHETLSFEGAIAFNSIYKPPVTKSGVHYLLQHFKGWMIESHPGSFNPEQALFMDFRVGQEEGLSFIYMLPLTDQRALIEYTQFSGALLADHLYDERIDEYVKTVLGLRDYAIADTEFGIIPMTNHPFARSHLGVWNIGTAGGQTKASTGYTFQFIQKQTAQIVDVLKEDATKLKSAFRQSSRFQFYDAVLLRILEQGKPTGRELFTRLFQKNRASDIFRFLDNESRFATDLKIINSLPTWPFTTAAIKEMIS